MRSYRHGSSVTPPRPQTLNTAAWVGTMMGHVQEQTPWNWWPIPGSDQNLNVPWSCQCVYGSAGTHETMPVALYIAGCGGYAIQFWNLSPNPGIFCLFIHELHPSHFVCLYVFETRSHWNVQASLELWIPPASASWAGITGISQKAQLWQCFCF